MDRTSQAITEYLKALDIYRDYAAAHYYLGLASMKTNEMKEARDAFAETVRLAPDTELGRASSGYLDLLK